MAQRITLDNTVEALYAPIINADHGRRQVQAKLSPMARTVIGNEIKNPDGTLALEGTEGLSYNLTEQAYDNALQGAQAVNTPAHYAAVEKQYLSKTDVVGKLNFAKDVMRQGVVPSSIPEQLKPILAQLQAMAGLEDALNSDKDEDIVGALREMGISDVQKNLSGLYHGVTLKALAGDIYKRKTNIMAQYIVETKQEDALLNTMKGAVDEKRAYAVAGAFAQLHYKLSGKRAEKAAAQTKAN